MEDDHVDRPGVEAQQCVKLTGTNSSFGLIALINQRPSHQTMATFENHLLLRALAKTEGFHCLSFAGLVALAKWPDPIPSRTRPSNASAPMVLCLKTRESRSPPGLPKTSQYPLHIPYLKQRPQQAAVRASENASRPSQTSPRKSQSEKKSLASQKRNQINAGWSSPVARQAHNLKVAGSNPAPATK